MSGVIDQASVDPADGGGACHPDNWNVLRSLRDDHFKARLRIGCSHIRATNK
jgi:hypothetical protein